MARAHKRLEAMRGNPRANWHIEDIQALCDALGVRCAAPKRGGHFKVSHPSVDAILTIPANRPIKTVYIKKLVEFLDCVMENSK
jgi:hypothetical protein